MNGAKYSGHQARAVWVHLKIVKIGGFRKWYLPKEISPTVHYFCLKSHRIFANGRE